MSDAMPCFSRCGFLVELSFIAARTKRTPCRKRIEGSLFPITDQFEIDSLTACRKPFRHWRMLSRRPKITLLRSGLNPISCAMAVSAEIGDRLVRKMICDSRRNLPGLAQRELRGVRCGYKNASVTKSTGGLGWWVSLKFAALDWSSRFAGSSCKFRVRPERIDEAIRNSMDRPSPRRRCGDYRSGHR